MCGWYPQIMSPDPLLSTYLFLNKKALTYMDNSVTTKAKIVKKYTHAITLDKTEFVTDRPTDRQTDRQTINLNVNIIPYFRRISIKLAYLKVRPSCEKNSEYQ